MNNNPVAYISKNGVLFKELPPAPMYLEPLYTHSVKTLTDEEIHDLIINKVTDADMIKQALKKAQEK